MNYKNVLDYAKQRNVVLPDEYYTVMSAAQRTASVSIAGLASIEQITSVINLVHTAIDSGSTFAEFQKSVSSLNLGLPSHRLDNIFRTNIQVAYAVGRYRQQQQNTSTHTYLKYSAINDVRVRPSHLVRNGTILRHDDSWWQKNTPPCGYRCRCTVISLTEEQAEKQGITSNPPNALPEKGWGFHPSQADAMIKKMIDERLGQLELDTKNSSHHISNFSVMAQATVDSEVLLSKIRATAISPDNTSIKLREKFIGLFDNYKLKVVGYTPSMADASLVIGSLNGGIEQLADLTSANFITTSQKIALAAVLYQFYLIDKYFLPDDVFWSVIKVDYLTFFTIFRSLTTENNEIYAEALAWCSAINSTKKTY